ncbi:MAG TPA: ATP-dependent DNA helicase RecG [Candidatus Peribacteraceae bacterium]|nr:ATP-dependent DNA helicase RecG [Candidatus Peribacteraceae bacterium]
MNLKTPLSTAIRTTKDHLDVLSDMDIKTVGDLLMYLPRSHEDLSQILTLYQAPLNEKVSIRGSIGSLKVVRIRGGKYLVSTTFTDTEGGIAEVVWFNQPHIKRMLPDGSEVVLTGKIIEKAHHIQMQSPQFEIAGSKPLVHAGRLVPIYPQHDLINTKWLREKMVLLKDAVDLIPETLPQSVVDAENLMPLKDAVRALHFPDTPEDVDRAKARLAFEEMYHVQVAALERKKAWQGAHQKRLVVPMDAQLIRDFFASLKFQPTNSQKIAIYEILRDMEKDVPMSRLLEGDVGSGKTLVAVAVMATVMRHGGQCALMVPTEVLARQHAENVSRLLLTLHTYLQAQIKEGASVHFASQNTRHDTFHLPNVALLTGSTPPAEARDIKTGLANGTVDIVIGTHALIEDSVQFKDIKLVIVDEQHRFGVNQRARLKDKGSPHFLAMTATPIPRTLALTAYGDHDLSVLLEKPGNRKVIKTKVVSPNDRKTVELFIDNQINEGRQVFVICPLITGSEAEEIKDVKSVEQEAKRLREGFPHRRIAVLHGKMPPKEKDDILKSFKAKESDILVSTSVIEVGIDVPNSTIIVIEGAERFGLAQLHQFRGRVGRGDHQSYCFLFTTTAEQAQSPRLKAMEEFDSGFQLAEIDLKLRGPGELFGLRQSGLPDFRFPHLYQPELIVRARHAAEKVIGISAGKAA